MSDYRESHLDRGGSYDALLKASAFDSYMADWEATYLIEIIRRFFPKGIPRYLDFACGTGRVTQVVADFAAEAIGVDVSRSMLDVASNKCPRARFVQVDLTKAEAALGLFDLITAFRFFGNADDALRDAVLSALRNRLRGGGFLVINNHRNPNSLAALGARLAGGTCEMDLSHRKLRGLLAKNGFKVVLTQPIGFWQYRARLQEAGQFHNAAHRVLERMFSNRFLVPLAPDAIIVAQRDA